MNAQDLMMLYEVNHHVLRVNLEGLSHEDALVQPAPGGNCVNWVLGHILATRNALFSLIGVEPVWPEADAARYRRGSDPVTRDAGIVPLDRMSGDLDRSQSQLMEALGRMTAEDLARPVGDATVSEKLAFLQFHEAYHAGQIAILRRMAGKPGAIR
jgi:uncharacterized damage-inducible protein DinB